MSRRNAVKTIIDSRGVRKRFDREVRDATEGLTMILTSRDIAAAKKARAGYSVDDPENFGECVLAKCVKKAAGMDVLIFRRHAYIAMPDADYAERYEIAPETMEIIRLNDEGRFDEIPVNTKIKLRPPAKSRRLVYMRANAKASGHYRATRGTARKQQAVDPMRGVWRNGIYATDAA